MRTVAVAAIILVSHRASAQSPATDAGIVEQYAASDASGAVKLLAPGNTRLPGDIVEWMRHLPDRQVRSAVMMHTELAAHGWSTDSLSRQTGHIGNAQRLLSVLSTR